MSLPACIFVKRTTLVAYVYRVIALLHGKISKGKLYFAYLKEKQHNVHIKTTHMEIYSPNSGRAHRDHEVQACHRKLPLKNVHNRKCAEINSGWLRRIKTYMHQQHVKGERCE